MALPGMFGEGEGMDFQGRQKPTIPDAWAAQKIAREATPGLTLARIGTADEINT